MLDKIVNHLILNTSSIPNLGLYNGKMGVIIFFFHLNNYRDLNLYEDFGYELLCEVLEDITADIGVDMEDGLCGILWGLEYLTEKNFIELENDIYDELDLYLTEYLNNEENLLSEKDLKGIMTFLNYRFHNQRLKNPFLLNIYLQYVDISNYIDSSIKILQLAYLSRYLKSNTSVNLGLSGYAGDGLSLMNIIQI